MGDGENVNRFPVNAIDDVVRKSPESAAYSKCSAPSISVSVVLCLAEWRGAIQVLEGSGTLNPLSGGP
jgi:hypothetical protein